MKIIWLYLKKKKQKSVIDIDNNLIYRSISF